MISEDVSKPRRVVSALNKRLICIKIKYIESIFEFSWFCISFLFIFILWRMQTIKCAIDTFMTTYIMNAIKSVTDYYY